MSKLLDLVTDAYERKARATPALLTVLPVVVPLVCQFGAKNPTLTAVLGVLGSCGAVHAAANVARGRGKLLEGRLVQRWDGLPTTALLRHRDGHYDPETKKRYHLDCLQRLGLRLPTAEEEASDPAKADGAYEAAARRLRELTRTDKGLLSRENAAYGFHRNMLAMKPIGIVTSLFGLFDGLVLAGAVRLDPLGFDVHVLASPGLAGGLSMLVGAVMLLAWVGYFNERQLRVIGVAYAERLFEKLPSIPKPRGAKAPPAAPG